MKNGIIYKITNKVNGKVYIGKTVQAFKSRVKAHKYKSCSAFNNAIKSHGWDNFNKEEFICALDENHLASLEEQTIKFYNSLAPNGYNLIEIDKGLNRYSQEIKNKISESRKEYYNNLEVKPEAPNKKEHIIIDNVEHKHCYKCDQNKVLLDYYKDKKRWDGLATQCKDCHNVLNRQNAAKRKLTPEQLAETYKTRQQAVSDGVKKAFADNPELRAKKALERSKPIIGTHVDTGVEIEFPSAKAASQYGFVNTRIGESIKTGKPHKNHTWKFK